MLYRSTTAIARLACLCRYKRFTRHHQQSAEPAPPYETRVEHLDRTTPATLEAEALLDAANARRNRPVRCLILPFSLRPERFGRRAASTGYGARRDHVFRQSTSELGQRARIVPPGRKLTRLLSPRQSRCAVPPAWRDHAERKSRFLAVLSWPSRPLSAAQAMPSAGWPLIEEVAKHASLASQAKAQVEAARAVVDETQAKPQMRFRASSPQSSDLTEPVTSHRTSLLDRAPSPFAQDVRNPLAVQIAKPNWMRLSIPYRGRLVLVPT